jgi:hypothetical protein
MALENHRAKGAMSSVSSPESSRVTSPFRASGSALKYTPYELPEIIPRLRTRRPSSSQSLHSKLSDPGQVSLHTHALLPMTPGNLTLAAGSELEMMSNVILNLVVNINIATKLLTHLFYSNNFLLSIQLQARNSRIYRWEFLYYLFLPS